MKDVYKVLMVEAAIGAVSAIVKALIGKIVSDNTTKIEIRHTIEERTTKFRNLLSVVSVNFIRFGNTNVTFPFLHGNPSLKQRTSCRWMFDQSEIWDESLEEEIVFECRRLDYGERANYEDYYRQMTSWVGSATSHFFMSHMSHSKMEDVAWFFSGETTNEKRLLLFDNLCLDWLATLNNVSQTTTQEYLQ